MVCGSRFHWVRECPNATSDDQKKKSGKAITDDQDENAFLTFFADACYKLQQECKFTGILDTACTSTVVGKNWLSSYIASLPVETKSLVSKRSCSSTVVFGGGDRREVLFICKLPVQIGELRCFLEVSIIDCSLPLLISVKSLTRAKAVIDLSALTMFLPGAGSDIPLIETSTGHLTVTLLPSSSMPNENLVLVSAQNVSDRDIEKLHKQFAHCSAKRFIKLIKNAGFQDNIDNRIEFVVSKCSVCLQYGRAGNRPKVGLPHSTDFNESVAMDLHQLGPKLWYFHVVDLFSKFSAGCIIRDKLATTIVSSFLRIWVYVFGAPKSTLSDNGGEFNNNLFLEMGELFDITVKCTATESPWSNGCCERQNQVLTEILLKLREENFEISWEESLHHALFAKNCLHSVHGYSPYQLVFGRNPRIPSIFTHEPPSLEVVNRSTAVERHITFQNACRQLYLRAESSSRIKKALKQRSCSDSQLPVAGDSVFYKRDGEDHWHGHGRVIGLDGRVVIVRHGGQVVRVHQTRLRVQLNDEETLEENNIAPSERETSPPINSTQRITTGESSPCVLEEVDAEKESTGAKLHVTKADSERDVSSNTNKPSENKTSAPINSKQRVTFGEKIESSPCAMQDGDADEESTQANLRDTNSYCELDALSNTDLVESAGDRMTKEPPAVSSHNFTTGDHVQFTVPNDDRIFTAKLIGRA